MTCGSILFTEADRALRGSLYFKLAVLVISIVIDCDRGHCYELLKKKF